MLGHFSNPLLNFLFGRLTSHLTIVIFHADFMRRGNIYGEKETPEGIPGVSTAVNQNLSPILPEIDLGSIRSTRW